jgi:hypothetical protein
MSSTPTAKSPKAYVGRTDESPSCMSFDDDVLSLITLSHESEGELAGRVVFLSNQVHALRHHNRT